MTRPKSKKPLEYKGNKPIESVQQFNAKIYRKEVSKRECLKCEKNFFSRSKINRLCNRCTAAISTFNDSIQLENL